MGSLRITWKAGWGTGTSEIMLRMSKVYRQRSSAEFQHQLQPHLFVSTSRFVQPKPAVESTEPETH